LSTKTKVTTFVVGPATARFPKLDQPYYYDNKLKKSVADPKGENKGSSLSVDLIMAEQDAAPLIKKIKDAAVEKGLDLDEVKNWPFSKEKDKDTKKPTGNIVFKLKKYALARDGSVNTVNFVDAKLNPLEKGFRLTSGSQIKANGYLQVYSELGGGVSLRLDSIQVLKLVERQANLSGFAVEDDGFGAADEGEGSYGGEEAHTDASDNTDF
jgi:hypothetical protein